MLRRVSPGRSYDICPYTAPAVNADRKAEINAAKCMGCGICAAECPAQAIELTHFARIQFNAMMDDLLNNHPETDKNNDVKEVGALK